MFSMGKLIFSVETVKEIGVNGLGMTGNGSTPITQMHIQQVITHYYSQDGTNILGNSVQSAIQATRNSVFALVPGLFLFQRIWRLEVGKSGVIWYNAIRHYTGPERSGVAIRYYSRLRLW